MAILPLRRCGSTSSCAIAASFPNVYTAAFLKGDESVVRTIDYAEGRLMNAKCPSYDRQRSGYCSTKDGADFRLVIYNANTC